MKKFIGIDLHSNNSVVVISDEEDRIVFQKRLPNDLNQIERVLAAHREEAVGVVVESTYNWYWLVDGLMDAGYRVHLAHPSAIKQYEGLKYSGDFVDAAYLAHLLRRFRSKSACLPRHTFLKAKHAEASPTNCFRLCGNRGG